ncbi:MAG: S1 RNA-binding domain-containing protein [Thermodesulfobacteriota bacterium]
MEENNIQNADEKSFEELLNENLGTADEDQKGRLVTGTVVRIDTDVVFVDLGLKSEGIIPIEEFRDKKGELDTEIGQEVEVLMEKTSSGLPQVSKSKADLYKERDYINKAFSENETISAIAVNKIKGGYLCNIGTNANISAFLPASQVDLHPSSEDIAGTEIEVLIIQNDNNGVVISRRKLLEGKREEQRKETLANLTEESVVKGEVFRLIDKGAFIDIGGLTAFIPIGEISWGRIKHPSDVLTVKDKVDVQVLKIENEGNRITVSHKHTTEDPWEHIKEKYIQGTKVTGKVVSTKEFGVFVELEPGVEGLIHVSELSWTRNFKHPKEIVEIDSPVEVVVIEANPQDKKLSLSLRQIEKSPWQIFKDENNIGDVLTGTIKNINEHGLFVEVSEDLVGLVRPENISWQGKVNPKESYESTRIGEQLDVSLLHIDIKSQKIALGIKQLIDDPWELARKKYKQGESMVAGKVKELRPNGLIVELENDVEGFYRNSELGQENETDKKYSIGDELTGLVISFEKNKRQVNLSTKRLVAKQEKERVSDFISSQGDSSAKLGDILGEKLKTLNS